MSSITKRFMIGQFGKFNTEKHIRDIRPEFFGVEACLFENQDEINYLIDSLKKDKFRLGIHFPLRANQWRLRDPQYLSQDEKQREQSFDYISSELKYVSVYNPEYVLVHYPKPVILDEKVDWTNWRFTDNTEYYYENQYTYEEFKEKSISFFKFISDKSKELNSLIILELDVVNKYIYDTGILEDMLNEFGNIRLCLDIGRLHLQEKLDGNFDSFKFTERFAKYAEVIHLWNVKVSSNLEYSHFPILPNQMVEDGWAEIERYIKIIKENNKTCKFLFEHRSDRITDEELEQCYEFIEEMLM